MKAPPFRRNVFCLCLMLLSISCATAQSTGYQEAGKIGDPESWRSDEFKGDWGLAAMKAEYAYAAGYTGKNIAFGVLDSGYYDNHPGLPASRFLPVSSGGISGVLNPKNNSHGTMVSGTVGAARDGKDMHGVAFDATVYEANTNATDGFLFGVSDPKFPTSDAKYFSAAYDALAAKGVRIISNSWGSQPASERYDTWTNIAGGYWQHEKFRQDNNGQGTWLDAAIKVSRNGVINNFSAGNTGYANASLRGSQPYFHPELEGSWMTTTGYDKSQGQIYNKCGIAKYWCVAAPTGTSSTSYSGSASSPTPTYANFSGTSAAAPHASAALALIMERYPYMTNEQALTVLFTTSQNMEVDTGKPVSRAPYAITPLKISSSKVPNDIVGWGLVDLQKAMDGPAQFLGRSDYNLSAGQKDSWRNDISQEAIVQRKKEERAEVDGWEARKATLVGSMPDDKLTAYLSGQRAGALALLKKLAASIATGSFDADYKAVQNNELAALMFSRLLPQTTDGGSFDLYFADPSSSRIKTIGKALGTKLNASSFAITDADLADVKAQLQFSYGTANDRIAYLTQKLADPSAYDAGLTKSGAGQLTLLGNNTYLGETRINGGELVIDKAASIVSASVVNNTGLFTVNGIAGNTTVNAGGVLRGTGSVGAATIAAGGTVAPGNSIGTLAVRGDFLQAAGSFYQAEVGPGGTSDRIAVDGTAYLQGGTVQIVRTGDVPFVFGQRYNLLTAAGGIVGSYAGLSGDAAPISLFVGPKLSYDAIGAYLDIAQVAPFAAVAATRNQAAAAAGADSLPDAGGLKLAVLNLQTVAQARSAFDQLGGELHASAKSALIEDSRFVREAVLRRLRSTPDAASRDAAPARGKDAQASASVPGRYGVWGQAFGSWGHAGGNAEAAKLSRSASGFMGGVDGPFGDEGRIGVVAGVSHTSFDVKDRQASGSSDNYNLGVYGGNEQGPLAVRTGLALTWNQLSTRRNVSFPGFAENLKGDSHARTAQAFGELAWKLKAGAADVEPFANLAHVNLSSSALRERGGAAALRGRGTDTDVTFSTLGVRTSFDFELGGLSATARASLGWRHGFGDLAPQMSSAMVGGAPFTVTGVPVAKNATLAELELDLRVAPRATLRVAYGGQFASKTKDQSVRASLDWRF